MGFFFCRKENSWCLSVWIVLMRKYRMLSFSASFSFCLGLKIDIVQLSVQLYVLVKGKVNWSGPIFLGHHSLYHALRSFGLGRAVQALVKAYYKAKRPPCFVVNGLSGYISKPEIGLQQALHPAQSQSLRSWYLTAQQGTNQVIA